MVVRKQGTATGETRAVQIGNYPLGSDMYKIAKALRYGEANLNLGDTLQPYLEGIFLLHKAGLLEYEEIAQKAWKRSISEFIQANKPASELPKVAKKKRTTKKNSK